MREFLSEEGDNVVNLWHLGHWSAGDGIAPQHLFYTTLWDATPEELLDVFIDYFWEVRIGGGIVVV